MQKEVYDSCKNSRKEYRSFTFRIYGYPNGISLKKLKWIKEQQIKQGSLHSLESNL